MTKKEIKMFTLFSGYESQMMGLKKSAEKFSAKFDVELVGWSDINPDVQLVHNMVFPEYADRCYPDVTKIDWTKVEDFDLLVYSSPCQSVSRAGKRKGIKKDSETESALLWAVEYGIAAKRPKWLVMENVEGMLDPDFTADYIDWIKTLTSYGYRSFYKVLCSADYGVPQNRRRLFLVSVRIDNDEPNLDFKWPTPQPLTLKPEDLLSDTVDDKYYLTAEETDTFIDLIRNADEGYKCNVQCDGQHPSKFLSSQFNRCVQRMVTPLCKNGTIPTLMTSNQSTNLAALTGCRRTKCPCVVEVWESDTPVTPIVQTEEKASCQSIRAEKKCSNRERVLDIVNHLSANQYLRIRRLTPEECLRFMGVDEFYINRMVRPKDTLLKEGYTLEKISQLMTINGKLRKVSDNILYGRAGNSIVVSVLEALFTQILKYYAGANLAFDSLSTMTKAEKKRLASRKYYQRHREEICQKSRVYHKNRRAQEKVQDLAA